MSDASQGPGWWQASDGKWYPPELHPGPPPGSGIPTYRSQEGGQPPYRGPGGPPYGAPYGAPGGMPYGAPGGMPYGAPGGPPYGAPYGAPGYAYPMMPRNNGLAVASLVCSIVTLFGLGSVLGIVFGFVARHQIRESGGTQRGDGLALAGIIVGFATLALTILYFVVLGVSAGSHCVHFGNSVSCSGGTIS